MTNPDHEPIVSNHSRLNSARTSRDETLIDDQTGCPPELVGFSGRGEGAPLPDLNFPSDPHLAAEGWERRFMADPRRAEEASDLYHTLGFEVRAEPVSPSELSAECTDCRLLVCRSFVTIYTRKK